MVQISLPRLAIAINVVSMQVFVDPAALHGLTLDVSRF